MSLAKLNRHGQITLPSRIRRELGLRPGDHVRIEKDISDRITLTPVTVRERGWTEQDLKRYETEGVDPSLIRSHLEMTPTQRLQNNKKMLDLIDYVQKNNPVGGPP